MINPNKILNIPQEEKNFIDPRVRPKFFKDVLDQYAQRYDNLTLLYAYLNTDPKNPLDYLVLFKTKNVEKTADLIVFDMPLLYSDRSLPGYRYCRRMNLLDDYFKEATASMVTLSEVRFNEFINTMLNLSVDPNNDLFWRKPEYVNEVIKGMLDLALRYNKRT